MKSLVRLWGSVLVFSVWAAGSPAIAAESYPLDAGDVVSVSIVPKPELNRDMTVGLDGTIFLPLIGYLNVRGRTIDQLREDIPNLMSGAVYRERIEGESVLVTIASDEVLVEIANYRPIYVDGSVEQPGELPFTVGLTVRQAVAAAQGFAAPEAPVRTFAEDNPIAIRARLSALQSELLYFDAIAKGNESVATDAVGRIEVLTAPVAEVASRMNLRLQNYWDSLARETETLDQSIESVEGRLSAEQERMAYVTGILAQARDKVSRIEDLAKRGFASPQDLDVAWDQYLAVSEQVLRAEERVETLETAKRAFVLERTTLENTRKEAAYQRMVELEAQALDLIGRLQVASVDPTSSAFDFTNDGYSYTVHRQTGDQYYDFKAETGTLLMPGDVLSVRAEGAETSPLLQITDSATDTAATAAN